MIISYWNYYTKRTMKVVQVINNLQRGDAIGNFTLMLRDVLINAGFDTDIYATNVGKGIDKSIIKSPRLLNLLKRDDVLIYQMCEGVPLNKLIMSLKCKKIAIYHNVTPPSFFSKWGKFMIDSQKKALQDMEMLNDVFDLCIAVSEFNKLDLIKMGYDENRIAVIPIIVDFDDYKQEPAKNIIENYKDGVTNILFVGRIAPNKKQEDIIRQFAYYHKYVNTNSRLILVGSPFNTDYYEDLLQYIEILGIDNVIIPGHISFQEILGYYRVADLFLCMSEHEGFCVPLLEAMMFEIPIVAYNSTAIPYTLGNSGVLINTKNPVFVSNIMERICKDESLRKQIVAGQNEQLKTFDRKRVEKLLLNEITSLIEDK